MNKFRAAIRGLLIALLIIIHVTPALVKAVFTGIDLPFALRMRRLWARRSLKVLGVKPERQGELPEGGPFLFVGNHRSYLDPIVVLSEIEALPIAKAEVGSWPLIGFGAKATGIMYVKRESKNSRAATLDAMRSTLNDGYSVLVYPEGTTHIEPATRDLKKGAFSVAARAGFMVVPMAIEYGDVQDAWVGSDTFIPHFVRCFGKKNTYVKIAYGVPIASEDPNFLLAETRKWIDENMVRLQTEFDPDKSSVG